MSKYLFPEQLMCTTPRCKKKLFRKKSHVPADAPRTVHPQEAPSPGRAHPQGIPSLRTLSHLQEVDARRSSSQIIRQELNHRIMTRPKPTTVEDGEQAASKTEVEAEAEAEA